jgi:putative sugar O-methyltransferase
MSCRKKEVKISPRCIYDQPVFAQVSLNAAEDEEQFSQFKKDPFFNLLWENHSAEEGEIWLQKIDDDYPFLKEMYEQFRRIDQFGSPRIYDFGRAGVFSPSTLRLIAMTGDLRVRVGNLANAHIVQIGAGYGSLCKILYDVFSFKSYTIVDLPEQLALAKKCLDKLEVKNVKFFTPEELPMGMVYDLAVSDMSFSEYNRSYQELFFDRILYRSISGYILGREFPKHYGIISMNSDELKMCFEKAGAFTEWEMQEPPNNREDYFIYWKKKGKS